MGTTAEPTSSTRWLKINEVEHRLSVSRMSIWRWTKQGGFPAAVYFGSRRAWRESDIVAWEASRAHQRSRAA